jgi:hypothetical protein
MVEVPPRGAGRPATGGRAQALDPVSKHGCRFREWNNGGAVLRLPVKAPQGRDPGQESVFIPSAAAPATALDHRHEKHC